MVSILVVEPKPILSPLIKKGAVEIVPTLEKIDRKKAYDLIFCFSEAWTVELVKEIEHLLPQDRSKVVLISESVMPVEELISIKKDFSFPFVFELPLSEDEIEGVFFCLEQTETPEPIILEYRKTFFIKLERLYVLLKEPQAKQLQEEVEFLADTTKEHGYPFAYNLCMSLSLFLQKHIEEQKDFAKKYKSTLDHFFRSIKVALQLPGFGVDKGIEWIKKEERETKLLSRYEYILRFYENNENVHNIVRLSLENYHEAVQKFGFREVENLLARFSHTFLCYFDKDAFCGRWEPNSILLTDQLLKRKQLIFLMDHLLDLLHDGGFVESHPEWKVEISYNSASVSEEGGTLEELIDTIEKKKLSQKEIPPTTEKEVLIVDPSVNVQKLLSIAWKELPWKVTFLSEGKEALDALKNRNKDNLPSLLILERQLSDYEGLEIAQAARQFFPDAPLPIWFLSARASFDDITDGLHSGANEYIVKPFNLKVLTEKIKKIFQS